MNLKSPFRTRTTALFYFAATASLCLQGVLAVKKEDFKTCEQAAFCRRHRAFADAIVQASQSTISKGSSSNLAVPSSASPYIITSKSVHLEGHTLVATILHDTDKVPLKLEVIFLADGTVRIRLQEENPLIPRFDETQKHVLRDEGNTLEYASADSIGYSSETAGQSVVHTVCYTKEGNNFAVRLTEFPWSLAYMQDNKVVIEINHNGFFNFEHLRTKPDTSETNGVEGEWEETFRSWTDSKPRGPESFGVDIRFNGYDHVYGIPEHSASLSLKNTRGDKDGYGEPYRLWNLDVFEYELDSPMALYGSIPFMVAHNPNSTVGVFWLNAAETWVDVTREKSSTLSSLFRLSGSSKEQAVNTHWISESGIMDVFLMPGPSVSDLYKQYTALVESTPLPREFALGYHQCRWNYIDQDDVLAVSDKMHEHNIPYDVIWLDIEYTDGKRYFTWDSNNFPDPVAMQKQLSHDGHKLVVVIDPHIKHDSAYYVWKEGNEKEYFIKNKAKTDNYQGWCWPGESNWVDYLDSNAMEWTSGLYHLDKFNGSTTDLFVWNDMNEPSIFNGPEITIERDLKHYGGWEHRDLHNIYGMLYHKATYNGLRTRESPNKRPFVLSRAYFAGSQRYGAIWTGDNAASWDHLHASVRMVLSNNIAGMHFSGADVGGFFGNPEPELLTRWYQLGIWYPFFRAHAHIDTKRREPWVAGEPYLSIMREAILERYRMLPHWYTLFRETSLTGMPIARPMWMEFPKDTGLFAEERAFMVGSSIMVVPSTDPDISKPIDVAFPSKENWYDMHTYTSYFAPTKRQFTIDLAQTLVFVRGGSIIPTRERQRRASALMKYDPFTLYVYVSRDGTATGKLYLDDGETYDYEEGAFIERELLFVDSRLSSRPSAHTVETSAQRIFLEKMKKVRVERVVIVGLRSPLTRATVTEGDVVREIELSCGGSKASSECVVRDPAVLVSNDWEIAFS
ncbi:glucosidase II [Coemansia spiralis]|uniref:Glucosidase II subunit alpha n=2 Tax=Coemansia TaxID=4863 RepID=A0A9W8G3K7_9FUNG|nr:glucosidase II [Coemansia umbellata]KAJ2619053.1 glucosidase II [Coemansia sp. RSA 1358]KAJ2669842.1 glucosidase II [Coemansia spiralis]